MASAANTPASLVQYFIDSSLAVRFHFFPNFTLILSLHRLHRVALFFVADRHQYFFRRRGQIHNSYTDRIVDCVHDGRDGRHHRRLADAFHSQGTDRIRILDNDRIDPRHIERCRQDVFGEARRAGLPIFQLVILHQCLSERLHDSAFDLSFHALGIDRATDIVRCPDSKDLDLARYRIDLDFGDLGPEYVGLPRTPRPIDRIKTRRIGAKTGGADGDYTAAFR